MGNVQTSSKGLNGLGPSKSSNYDGKKQNLSEDSTKSCLAKTASGSSGIKGEVGSKQLLEMFKMNEDHEKKEYAKVFEKIKIFKPKVATFSKGPQKRDLRVH